MKLASKCTQGLGLINRHYPNGALLEIVGINRSHFISPEDAAKIASLTDEEYQHLHKSGIATYHFQPGLLRLPIPKLEKTCQRYLKSIQPLITTEQYSATSKLVEQFQASDGLELQKELKAFDKQNKDTSYISEPWFKMYLESRLPVPVHYNPFMAFAQDPQKEYNDQLCRATNFVISIGRFKRSLDAKILSPEVYHINPKKSDTATFRRVCNTLPSRLSWLAAAFAFKAYPLDMSQYPSLFNGTRIPKQNCDVLYDDPSARHIVVFRKGHAFSVELFDKNGNLHEPEVIHSSLAHVLSSPLKETNDAAVGILTTSDRDTWAETRQELEGTSEKNKNALRLIDGAVFALFLDELVSEDPQRLIKSLLCGDDASNRWFDKRFQLIVDGNGMATINFEHAWGDGVAVLRLMEETFKDTSLNHFVHSKQQVSPLIDPSLFVKSIDFDITESLEQKIRDAREKHLAFCTGLEFDTVEYLELNRRSIKGHGVSPDALMQLAIQLSFYRMYGKVVPSYESCSTAAFLKGRTECVRAATNVTSETVKALLTDQKAAHRQSDEQLKQMITNCSAVHSKLVKEAALGQGFDRHLMGLKMTAHRLNRPIPALFADDVYKYVNQFILSTSTLSTPTIVFGGFGPVVANGFGIGYNVIDSKVGCVISAYKKERSARQLAEAMHTSLDEIRSILENTKE